LHEGRVGKPRPKRDFDLLPGVLVQVGVGVAQVRALGRVDEIADSALDGRLVADDRIVDRLEPSLDLSLDLSLAAVKRAASCPGATLSSVWSTRE
jgi:hypothetical protein